MSVVYGGECGDCISSRELIDRGDNHQPERIGYHCDLPRDDSAACIILASAPPSETGASSQSAGSGTITVELDPSTTTGAVSPVSQAPQSSSSVSPSVLPAINCQVNLGQFVHYSVPGKDVSWHWTWTCDGDVTLTASSVLRASVLGAVFPIAFGSSSQTGFSGNVNVRTSECIRTSWYGEASGTFSAPNHLSRTFEGSSPTSKITCS